MFHSVRACKKRKSALNYIYYLIILYKFKKKFPRLQRHTIFFFFWFGGHIRLVFFSGIPEDVNYFSFLTSSSVNSKLKLIPIIKKILISQQIKFRILKNLRTLGQIQISRYTQNSCAELKSRKGGRTN